MSVIEVRAWRLGEAEAALCAAGMARISSIAIAPPRGRASGDERVVRQTTADDGAVLLTIAREMTRLDAQGHKGSRSGL